ncbi:KH domain protein [Ancylostoma caninum]|uniref:KH domain protein n=1 Tax=Ancylostoma caninum TaxID=29170 RepID=A0A368G5R5_ANCCA|nr:KH domain protein [Ancylostoma caninum]
MPAQQMAFLPQNPLFIPPDTPPATHPTNAGFYLIPASGGWMPPMIPGMPPNPFMPQPLINPEAVLMRQRSLKKPNQTKALQLRHEMIIRNSDSGKIMGVKGRRVALVEQMTNTVISFQKGYCGQGVEQRMPLQVDSKSKERTLTITASSMEDIERAKDLIIETIKRNMSPIRADQAVHEVPEEEDENENDISIETTQDGMLKLCCSDPQVLQAAQEALSEYLRARARPSAEEREKRKERRKSMPLQASHPEPPPKVFHG